MEYVADKDDWYCRFHAEAWREWSAAMKAKDPRAAQRVFSRLL